MFLVPRFAASARTRKAAALRTRHARSTRGDALADAARQCRDVASPIAGVWRRRRARRGRRRGDALPRHRPRARARDFASRRLYRYRERASIERRPTLTWSRRDWRARATRGSWDQGCWSRPC